MRDWNMFAWLSARDACENNFSSHRGVWDYVDDGVSVFYSNTGDDFAAEEVAAVREVVEANGARVVGEAMYDNYTRTIVIRGLPHQVVYDLTKTPLFELLRARHASVR